MLPNNGERHRSPDASPSDRLGATAEGLTQRFWERIRVFAARRVADPSQAEDIAQETIGRVLEALRAGRVANLDALPGFVFQTARHLCLHGYRAASRQARAFVRLAADDHLSPVEEDPLVRLISEEDQRRVRLAIADLSESDQALLRALYYEQADPTDLATRLGITPVALRVRRHRAVQRLAAALQRREPIGNS